MADETGDWEAKWELLMADAWADPDLKKRLLADPAAVLKERGMAPPEGVEVKVVAETEKSLCLVLPVKPAEGELSEEELEGVAGGFCFPPPRPCCGPPRMCCGPPRMCRPMCRGGGRPCRGCRP